VPNGDDDDGLQQHNFGMDLVQNTDNYRHSRQPSSSLKRGEFLYYAEAPDENPRMVWMTMLKVYRTVLAPVFPCSPSDYCQPALSEFYHVAVNVWA
jgi:hypothetical protein